MTIAFAPPPLLVATERPARNEGAIEHAVVGIQAAIMPRLARFRARALARVVAPANAREARLRALSDDELRGEVTTVRRDLAGRDDFELAAVAASFALVREASRRVLGLRHHDVQLIGAHALLKGMIAEMDTGEGKTLTATLAAVTAALAGIPVHIVTVNDYLAARDAETLAPLYAFFGLTVGVVVHGLEPPARRAAYRRQITYCTNKELTFDYLRDRVALGQRRSRIARKLHGLDAPEADRDEPLIPGLHFAIVDEADSVLVDEARTPLILSREARSQQEARVLEQGLAVARALEAGPHYLLLADERQIVLHAGGITEIERLTRPLGGPWLSRVQREETIRQALTALLLMNRDEQYIVRDGKVQIVDEYTGRIMADRFWTEGLHQLVELKEGCELSGKRLTLARMTYQRFFRRYRRLAGMTGTAEEIASELWRVYRLAVARVPTHRPSRRALGTDRVFRTGADKWAAITRETAALVARGVPVLIGTRSVAGSLEASACLESAGIEHVVLNAAQDKAEAEIVAAAGHPGRVTVATNMAGRGTDIKLAEGVSARGGLHVIMSERHDASRIDRQLAGRCARQGEPGAFRAFLSLDDPLFAALPLRFIRPITALGMRLFGQAVGRFALRQAQLHAERIHARIRRELLKHDETIDHALAFTGHSE